MLVVKQITILVAVFDALLAANNILLGNWCTWRNVGIFLSAVSGYGSGRDSRRLVARVDADLCIQVILHNVSQVWKIGSGRLTLLWNVLQSKSHFSNNLTCLHFSCVHMLPYVKGANNEKTTIAKMR